MEIERAATNGDQQNTKKGLSMSTTLLPARFLVRIAHPCRYVKGMPAQKADYIVDLTEANRIDNLAGLEGRQNFADVRLGWNENGLGFQVEVRGKKADPKGNPDRPGASDVVSLWIDTRDARTGHRASRTCHLFHFFPAAGGSDRDEPVVVQAKIHRALQDAPHCASGAIPFLAERVRGGYRIEAFLPAAVLTGFDPEQNPRLGFTYAVRDHELGEQTLSMDADFPYAQDPSLWSVLELIR